MAEVISPSWGRRRKPQDTRMGVAAHRPAVFSQWLNRPEVSVGTVKAGRMVWRNSLSADTDDPGFRSDEKWAVGRNALSWQAISREPYPLLIRQYPQLGARRRQAPETYPPGAEREGYLPIISPPAPAMPQAKAKTPIHRVWCRKPDTDNAEILPLTQ